MVNRETKEAEKEDDSGKSRGSGTDFIAFTQASNYLLHLSRKLKDTNPKFNADILSKECSFLIRCPIETDDIAMEEASMRLLLLTVVLRKMCFYKDVGRSSSISPSVL